MNKAQLLEALRVGREKFLQAIEGLSDEEMVQPGVVGDWSVKDILVHLTRWEAELVKLLWQAGQGVKPTTVHFTSSSVDDINARWYAESRDRPLSLALQDFNAVRVQTIRRVNELPEEALVDADHFPWAESQPLWKWIAGDSFEHEAEHEAQIRSWRNQRHQNQNDSS